MVQHCGFALASVQTFSKSFALFGALLGSLQSRAVKIEKVKQLEIYQNTELTSTEDFLPTTPVEIQSFPVVKKTLNYHSISYLLCCSKF